MIIQNKGKNFSSRVFEIGNTFKHITVKEVEGKQEFFNNKDKGRIYKKLYQKYKNIKQIKTCKSLNGKEVLVVIIEK